MESTETSKIFESTEPNKIKDFLTVNAKVILAVILIIVILIVLVLHDKKFLVQSKESSWNIEKAVEEFLTYQKSLIN